MPDLLTQPPPDLKRYRASTTLTMRGATETQALPAGVCGQVEGVAMVYNVVDSYGTTFAKGCLDRTVRERVAAGKVRLFFDHGDVPMTGMYDTHLHIGVVREVWDSTTSDGQDCAMFRADIFDTASGRSAHEYLQAIAATRAETGVSIGMMKEPEMKPCMVGDQPAMRVAEVALGEISVTSMSAVPGTRVTQVRADKPHTFEIVEPVKAEKAEESKSTYTWLLTANGQRFKVSGQGRFNTPPVLETIGDTERASVIIGGSMTDTSTLALTPPNYFALLDGIVAHLGADAVRAHLGATVSNADGVNSDAGASGPDSNVTPTDSPGVSQGGTEPPLPNVPMEDRIAFLRRTYAPDYSP